MRRATPNDGDLRCIRRAPFPRRTTAPSIKIGNRRATVTFENARLVNKAGSGSLLTYEIPLRPVEGNGFPAEKFQLVVRVDLVGNRSSMRPCA